MATLDLTDQGDSHRFSKKYFVPADPTGEGYYLLITTSVYTDSGYTTKAEMYGDKYETYLVDQRAKRFGGGGEGSDIDYKRVRQIVEDVVGQKIAEIPPTPPVPPVNITPQLQPVLNALSGLRNDVQSVEIPPNDYSGIERRLDLLQTAIEEKEVTPATELGPVLTVLDEVQSALKPHTEQVGKDTEAILAKIKDFYSKDIQNILKKLATLQQKLNQMPFLMLGQPAKTDTTEEEEEIDYESLINS